MTAYAYTRYDIQTLDEQYVIVHFETNDDGDTGWPGVFARDDLDYRGPGALAKALKHTGKSRQGIGHRVFVTVDGEEI